MKTTLEDLEKPKQVPPNDGGPAFPLDSRISESHYGHRDAYWGVTVRDYFAAKALQGSLASGDLCDDDAQLARYCYEFADAMLKARGQ